MPDIVRIGDYSVPVTPWISPKVIVASSPGKGTGLFASESIAAGEKVLGWGGPTYTDQEGAKAARAKGLGVMQWDTNLFSCEGGELQDAFAINHSCDPNVWLDDVFTLTARRNIALGEELAMDYATLRGTDASQADWACQCATPGCRERVTGADWQIEVLRQRYAGHFTPWLSQRIAAERACDATGIE